jgi:hypothetical protein
VFGKFLQRADSCGFADTAVGRWQKTKLHPSGSRPIKLPREATD